jgi:hypothetical protein
MLSTARALILVAATPLCLQAHQVPNITAEAMFASSGEYTLRISLDPRVFLSDQPTTLPPVPAEWFTSQTPQEVAENWDRAQTYLDENFGLEFGDAVAELPEAAFRAMDGATNEPLSDATAEVHILATLKGAVPATGVGEAIGFKLAFGEKANTSLILLNSVDDTPERRPQVLFPGETSRVFEIPSPPSPEPVLAPPPPSSPPNQEEAEAAVAAFMKKVRWIVLATAILLGFGLKRLLFPKNARDPSLNRSDP